METQGQGTCKKRIGELLLDAGIIRAEELPVGLRQAQERSLRLGEVLVMLRYLSAEDLEAVLQAQTRLIEGDVSERRAVEALRIASTHRLSFDKALEKVEKEPQERRPELVSQLLALQSELQQTERIHGPSNRDVGNICLRIGDLHRKLGDNGEAEKTYRRALQIFERSFGQRNLKVANCLSNLADLYFAQKRLADAETLYWRVLDITQGAWGDEHLDVAKCKQSLAQLLEAQNRMKEAEQLYLSSLRIIERVAGEDHPDLTDGLRHLAVFWSKQGKRPERKRLGDLLVEAGLLHPDQLQQALQQMSHGGRPLGQALVRLGHVTEEDLRPALQAQLLVGDGVLPLPLAIRALRIARQRRSFEEALKELGWEPDNFTTSELKTLITAAEELMTAEVALGSEHAGVAILSMKLADIHTAQKKFAEAEPLYLRAIEILEKSFGPKDSEVACGLFKLANMHVAQNKGMDAEPLLWRAVEIRQHSTSIDQQGETADCLDLLGQLQEKQYNYEQAEKLYQSSLSIRESSTGKSHPKTLTTLNRLADIYCQQKKFDDAESLLLRMLKAQEKEFGPMNAQLVPHLKKLGELYFDRKDFAKAETQFELALEIIGGGEGPESPVTPELRADLMHKYSLLLESKKNKS